MADMTDMTPEQKREAISKCKVLELRVLVLPDGDFPEALTDALETAAREHGVFTVSNQNLVLEEADIEEALENWGQVAQVVETLVDE